MIQLLFFVLFVEGLVAFLLVVKIGLFRELVMKGLDMVRMRKGTVLTIAGTFAAILLSNFISIVKIQNKGAKLGTMSPMDQVLWRTNLLEASLMDNGTWQHNIFGQQIHGFLLQLVSLTVVISALILYFWELMKYRSE